MVIFNTYGLRGYVAMDINDGSIIWDNRGMTTASHLSSRPMQVGDKFYFIKGSRFFAMDLNNGNTLENFLWPPNNEWLNSRISHFEGTLYMTLKEYTKPTFAELVSTKIDDLSYSNWTRFLRTTPSENNGYKPSYFAPTVYMKENEEKLLIFARGFYKNIDDSYYNFQAYNLNTQELEWTTEDSFMNSFAQPKIDGDRVYTHTDDKIYCLNANTGETIWDYDISTTGFNIVLSTIAVGLVLHEDVLLGIGKNDKNICLDKFTGQVRWRYTFDDQKDLDRQADSSQPETHCIYKDKIYYINGSGGITSVDIYNGGAYKQYYMPQYSYYAAFDTTLFEKKFGSFGSGGMTISEDGVLFTSDEFRFLAFKIPDE